MWRGLADMRGRVADADVRRVADECDLSLLQAQREVCAAGCLPLRYTRNSTTLSPEEQGKLLAGRVLLVGLGGLGGHILDMLARMGVGHITGVDGDIFEESNANRQLLCTQESMNGAKTAAAARHAALVNAAVQFTPVPHFVRGAEFGPLVADVNVVVDALGGLEHRPALHKAARDAGKPVVSAGIAGLTGWLAVVRPEGINPVSLLGQDAVTPTGPAETSPSAGATDATSPALSAEERLGNLAPTVATAAALQCAEILKLLTGRPALEGLLLFDLADHSFTKVRL